MPRVSKKTANKREIIGLIVIALGIFMLVTIFTDSTGIVGQAIRPMFFGAFGIFEYVLPFVFIALGVMFVLSRKKTLHKLKIFFACLGSISIMPFVHIILTPNSPIGTFQDYVLNSYTLNHSGVISGGGAFSSAIAYPFLKYFGFLGALLILATIIFACAIIVTKLSLTKILEGGADKMKTAIDKQKQYIQVKKEEKELAKENLKPLGSNGLYIDTIDSKGLKIFNIDDDVKDDLKKGDKLGDIKKEPQDGIVYKHFADNPKANPMPTVSQTLKSDNQATEKTGEPQNIIAKQASFYIKPPIQLLSLPKGLKSTMDKDDIRAKAKILEDTFKSFGITVKVTNVSKGPAITRYELQPAPGVKVSRIVNLSDDIALNLAAPGVRIEAPIPGKAAVGIEVPNSTVSTVALRQVLESSEFHEHKSSVAFALGKDIAGNNIVADIAKMPHLLIAGATGSGKSVCINDILISLLYRSTPNELRLIMVDPKVVELSVYNGIPHLLTPVVTDPKKAAGALNWAIQEMTARYKKFATVGVRDIASFNESIPTNTESKDEPLYHLVVIVDELADLMMVAPNDVEDAICRIAQMGRAAGIHLVIATQRPSVDVITGVIKANIPSRIAFAVASQIDSRTILDMGGAEKLLGRGDMLYSPSGSSKPVRVQGAFVSDKEVEAVISYIKKQTEPKYDDQITRDIETSAETKAQTQKDNDMDELLPDAVRIVMDTGQASISLIQRRLRVGYARAARLIDEMEVRGIVSGFEGSKARNVLIGEAKYAELFGHNEDEGVN